MKKISLIPLLSISILFCSFLLFFAFTQKKEEFYIAEAYKNNSYQQNSLVTLMSIKIRNLKKYQILITAEIIMTLFHGH